MCNYCKDIKEFNTYKELFKNIKNDTDENLVLVTQDNKRDFIIKDGAGGDPYERGIALYGIEFCPYCGRKLE